MFFVRDADIAATPNAPLRWALLWRLCALLTLPADSFIPGHTPAQDARWPAVGKIVMSAPVSAMITSATVCEMPGIVTSASRAGAKGDRQVVTGSGGSGQHLGILGIAGITYTDATPTTGELWPKLCDAVRQVGAQRFTRATHVVMNPLTWGWLLSTLDTTGRPLFAVGGSAGAFNAMGASDTAGYDLAGSMLGCRVLLSGNVPTNLGGGSNETRVIAADLRDSFLWEDTNAPVFIRAEQPQAASLGILFVAYSYSAFAAGRQPKAISVISGTGLILPAL